MSEPLDTEGTAVQEIAELRRSLRAQPDDFGARIELADALALRCWQRIDDQTVPAADLTADLDAAIEVLESLPSMAAEDENGDRGGNRLPAARSSRPRARSRR
jgi:hypothetical protein